MSKGNELWFYCSCPVPTRLSVFNKQAGQVRRSCCLISLCSTLRGHDVLWYLLPRAQPGHLPLPSRGKQKNMQTSFLLNVASAGAASQQQCWFTEESALAPAVASSRCFSNECRKLNKTINILPYDLRKCSDINAKQLNFI